MRLLLILCVGAGLQSARAVRAGDAWPEALRAMPLPANVVLNRDNAMEVFLDAFRSNTVVKALVFLPGVADDFYLIHRAAPPLNLRATNLLQAVQALTNATSLRASFRAPFLLLHVARDAVEVACAADDSSTSSELGARRSLPSLRLADAHWETVQPVLEKALERTVRPAAASREAWHFQRHNLAGWGLTDWETLSALSLAGGTRVTVQKRAIMFQRRDIP